MPLFIGRVGALSHHYSVPRSAYYDPSQETSLIFLNESSLSKLKLAYDAKSPLKTYTLWEYALKNSNSFVMPSLTNLKSKIGQALEMTVKEDEEFWDTLHATGDKIIIFENPHWFLGRHRPGNGEYWTGRNELGDLLMLVRDSYRGSLARLMPLQAFPLSSPSISATSLGLLETGRRPLSVSSPSGQIRPLSITTMDRIPSGPFSRLVGPSGSIDGRSSASFAPLFNHHIPDTFEDTHLPFLDDYAASPALSHNLAPLRPTSLSMRSPRSSVSSSGFSPPPPYASNPASPMGSRAFDFPSSDSHGILPRLDVESIYRARTDLRPTSRNTYPQQPQTFPHRLRVAPVTEDSERQALNQLRENYHQDSNRNKSTLETEISILRNANLRRMNRQEIADVQRQLREAERMRAIAEVRLAEINLNHAHSSTSVINPAVSQSLQKADELGAQRAREIEGKIVAHRRAMRDACDRRREREFGGIERLAGGNARYGAMAVD